MLNRNFFVVYSIREVYCDITMLEVPCGVCVECICVVFQVAVYMH